MTTHGVTLMDCYLNLIFSLLSLFINPASDRPSGFILHCSALQSNNRPWSWQQLMAPMGYPLHRWSSFSLHSLQSRWTQWHIVTHSHLHRSLFAFTALDRMLQLAAVRITEERRGSRNKSRSQTKSSDEKNCLQDVVGAAELQGCKHLSHLHPSASPSLPPSTPP